MTDFTLIKKFVDAQYQNAIVIIDHEEIALKFQSSVLRRFDEATFIDQLIILGYIPDLYESDSSEETLYSKLVEVFLCEWANRMGYIGKFVKQKASFEDVNIEINNNIIVADAKSFRLGRSQQAPNVKDFVKPEDFRKWIERHEHGLGGLVAYPCKHEWTNKSDAYKYCSSQNMPILMLPYKYLAFLLYEKNAKGKFIDISPLWDYPRIFPRQVSRRVDYWNIVTREILNVTEATQDELNTFLQYANALIRNYISNVIQELSERKIQAINEIQEHINAIMDIDVLKAQYIQYKTNTETRIFDILADRIAKFRF